MPGATETSWARVIFVLTEFQVMDAETARANEAGDNSHASTRRASTSASSSASPAAKRGLRDGEPTGRVQLLDPSEVEVADDDNEDDDD